MAILENQKHEKFSQLIAKGKSATDAYSEVYGDDKSGAGQSGSRLLKNVNIASRVQELQGKAESSLVLSLAEKRKFLADLVRVPIGEVDQNSQLCQEYTTHWEGGRRDGEEPTEVVKFKMPDKLRALELDAKLAGELTEKKQVEHTASEPLIDSLKALIFPNEQPKA